MTRPSNFAADAELPAAALNAALDGKADLVAGHLPDDQVPAALSAAVAEAHALAAAAVPGASVGQPGGPAGPLGVDDLVPAAQLGLIAGSGIFVSGRTISAAGGSASLRFAPPLAADLPFWLTRSDGALGQNGVAVDTPGGLALAFPSNTGISRLRGVFMPVPAGSYQLITRIRRTSGMPINYHCPGVGWLNASALIADHLAMTTENTFSHSLTRFVWPNVVQDTNAPGNGAGVTSHGANQIIVRPCWGFQEISFRLTKTATNRWFEISTDETHWEFVQGTAVSDPTTPTHIGILGGTYHGLSDPAGVHPLRLVIPRWEITPVADDWTPVPPAGTPLA